MLLHSAVCFLWKINKQDRSNKHTGNLKENCQSHHQKFALCLNPFKTVSTILKIFFFLSGFSFTNIYSSQESRGMGEAVSLTPLFHFHPLYRHFYINRAITAELQPLHITSSWIRNGNLWFSSLSH